MRVTADHLDRILGRYRPTFLTKVHCLQSIEVVEEQGESKVLFHIDSANKEDLDSAQLAANSLRSILDADHDIEVAVEVKPPETKKE